MAKKRGRGRPRLNPGEKKNFPRQVMMTPDLDARVKRATKEEGITISELVRRLLEHWLGDRGKH